MNRSSVRAKRLTFRAFLSHRYKSPRENLTFYHLFTRLANVQFEADVGNSATNVTKLERMIRNSDAFVGIYPFPESFDKSRDQKELNKASRYFRLELDLAIRSRKPCIVFYDQRYRGILKFPEGSAEYAFDSRELESVLLRREGVFADAVDQFCETVRISMAYNRASVVKEKSRVGLFLPQSARTGAYLPDHIEAIRAMLAKHGFTDISESEWPPRLDSRTLASIENLDFAVVDVGAESSRLGIPAYLHGRFVPTLRLEYMPHASPKQRPADFGTLLRESVEVGYYKDVFNWANLSQLNKGLNGRLRSIRVEVDQNIRLISNVDEAADYFQSAARRSEPVFISYSGRDRDLVAPICAAFRERFRNVFDYKDGISIRPGREWLPEIFDRLASSAIGLPMLSTHYFESRNCQQEVQMMVAKYNDHKLELLPVQLNKAKVPIPTWMPQVQYCYLSRTPKEKLVELVFSMLQDSKASKASG